MESRVGKMSKKYDFEYVKKSFRTHGCELVSSEYKNNKQKLEYVCVCGETAFTTFDHFLSGNKRCRKCGDKVGTLKRRPSIETIRDYFESNGCTVLSDTYINNKTNLDYICICGNQAITTYNKFSKGCRCSKCANNEVFTIEYVKECFELHSCTLLSTEYTNNKQRLDYICICGNKSNIDFYSFRKGHRCSFCKGVSIRKLRAYPFEYVKSFFEDNNCKLISIDYINNTELLEYICHCGRPANIRFGDFLSGVRCKECRNDRVREAISGEKHWNWNPELTDEDREERRNIPEYGIWVKSVFERDDYTCQCCLNRGNKLNAHHKDGFHWCIERRFDLDNGSTLCEECHSTFHKMYGIKYNTEEQFLEYLILKRIKSEEVS